MVGNKADFPKIAVIGGGTGSFTILRELKNFTPNISAIVNMSDNGGSTGKLRDELGVLPPGDLRQAFAALCESPHLREVLSYRFEQGSLKNHTFGNLFIATLEKLFGKAEAIKQANEILRIIGQVIPVTWDSHNLVMRDGQKTIRGEHQIDDEGYIVTSKNPSVSLEPKAKINPEAKKAILDANILVIAPGSLYGSLLAPLLVEGVRKAIAKSPAKKVIITNLVTTAGQTKGWHAVDYVKKLESVLGAGTFDFVLYNNHTPSQKLLQKYAAEGELVSFEPSRFAGVKAQPIGDNLIAAQTLIRHNPQKVCQHLMQIFYAD